MIYCLRDLEKAKSNFLSLVCTDILQKFVLVLLNTITLRVTLSRDVINTIIYHVEIFETIMEHLSLNA
jgi:hypothetical protein